MEGLDLLRRILDELPGRLGKISSSAAGFRRAGWSAKEELGHLLDSAANNHQRIVGAQLEDKPAMPGYDGDKWVELHAYQDRDWSELIQLWSAVNVQLLWAAEAVDNAAWSRTCTVGGSEPLTLKFVFEDYLDHMLHHLRHMGIEVDDLKSPGNALRQAGD